ncbi:helix-turn-helix domain-containing protein, partial [Burkholderia stagnalis]|uniref:helix-turn-helix domain-containing protein n=1 Tax=Burkholderia stagnalis TaxID=1503054 RepID=UPI0021AB88C6
MYRGALVTLNMRELDRLKVIQAVVDTGLKPGRAAERLGLTVRQVQRTRSINDADQSRGVKRVIQRSSTGMA